MKRSILILTTMLTASMSGVAQTDVLDELTFDESRTPNERSIAEEASQADADDSEDQPKVYYNEFNTATLRALDKITGRSTDIAVVANDAVVFGSLAVELQACFQTPPELPPESAAFLTITSTQAVQVDDMDTAVDAESVDTVSEDNPTLFSGWMFASSPGLSALEHPVYDIWVIRCTASLPVEGAESE
ncbi:MAG: DUF2155 domain-containing protein [Pseudomonadota bacterium]